MDVATFFAEHHGALFRYLVRFCGDPDLAADAAQEAFVRLIERPPRGQVQRAWLYTVATNVVVDAGRTRARQGRLLAAVPDRAPHGAPPLDAQARVESDERVRTVRAALATLPERDRTVLLMREEGFSHREIAEAVGTTAGSIGTMIARALDRLAGALPLDAPTVQPASREEADAQPVTVASA